MQIFRSAALLVIFAAIFLGGCGSKEPEKPPSAQAPQPAAQKAEPAPAPVEATPAAPAAKSPLPGAKAPAPAPAQKSSGGTAAPIPSAVTKEPKAMEAVRPPEPPAPAKPAPAKPAETAPTPAAPPAEKPALPAAPAKASAKDVVILKAALGGVRFEHKAHAETRKVACETCHHASRPEKPAAAPQQACGACHAATAAPPMKTKRQAAFHNPMATAGTCIDCHKTQNAKGGAAPVKCLECHKKEIT